MRNRIGINLRSSIKIFNPNYRVIRHHKSDGVYSLFGSSPTLEGAIFIADSGFLEDEIYNDCEELEGMGLGFSYMVFDFRRQIVYEKQGVNIN